MTNNFMSKVSCSDIRATLDAATPGTKVCFDFGELVGRVILNNDRCECASFKFPVPTNEESFEHELIANDDILRIVAYRLKPFSNNAVVSHSQDGRMKCVFNDTVHVDPLTIDTLLSETSRQIWFEADLIAGTFTVSTKKYDLIDETATKKRERRIVERIFEFSTDFLRHKRKAARKKKKKKIPADEILRRVRRDRR